MIPPASVAAAGALIGEQALKVGTIVKFSQNVLIGLAAFLISAVVGLKEENLSRKERRRPSVKIIWERFPKFVLGFVAASLDLLFPA
ncbi:MAG: putative sulfate exporter family transporter [Pyrinomonadaceae bacterium]